MISVLTSGDVDAKAVGCQGLPYLPLPREMKTESICGLEWAIPSASSSKGTISAYSRLLMVSLFLIAT